MTEVEPQWKTPPRPKARKARGRARPDEPLASMCAAFIERVCTVRATDRHHIVRRSQGGTDDATNTKDLCHPCHMWVHEHPAAARKLGLLGTRGETDDAP